MPTFSRSLEQSLHRALALANERHHEYATLEHLLLALLEDQDADNDALVAAISKVGESSQKMGAAMYAAAEADQAAAGGSDTSTGAADDDVVDAEIVDEPADEAGEDEAK